MVSSYIDDGSPIFIPSTFLWSYNQLTPTVNTKIEQGCYHILSLPDISVAPWLLFYPYIFSVTNKIHEAVNARMANSPLFRLNILPLSLFSLLVSGLAGAVPAPHPDSTDYEGVVPGSLGDAGSDGSTGASGAEGGSIKIPKGGLIAIIIVVVIVVIIGSTSTTIYKIDFLMYSSI